MSVRRVRVRRMRARRVRKVSGLLCDTLPPLLLCEFRKNWVRVIVKVRVRRGRVRRVRLRRVRRVEKGEVEKGESRPGSSTAVAWLRIDP